MADNVAQSIKDLQKDLSQLDKQVLSTKEGWDALVNTVVKGMEKSSASVKDLYKEVSSKASAKDVLKIKAVFEFDKNEIQKQIDNLRQAIKSKDGTPVKIGNDLITSVPQMKSALAELQNQMRAIPKSGAEAYDVIYRVVERYNTARQKTIEKNDKILSQLIKEEEREKAITREIERRQAKERNKLVSSNTSARLADEKRSTQMINAEYKSRERYAAEREKYIRNLESTNHLARMRDEQRSTQMINAEYKKREKEAERHKRQIESTNRSLKSMLHTLRRLAGAFGVAFSVKGLVQFGKKLIETRGEFELHQVALRSIIQNKQLADEIWDKTMQAALQSPFTAMQLTRYTKQLAAYRIETDKLFDTTKRLADVSAGLGVDMQRLILAYGQVKAANYLRASEIRQFTEAGVNILGELSTYLSKTRGEFISTAKVMDMVQKRMVTFSDVEAIFKRMTDEGGIFYNMQYVQSQTVKGQINKLHDAYDQMLNSIGKGNEGVLKDIVAALNNIVQNWRYWAAAIKSIAFGTIMASLTKLGVTLTGINVAGIAAGKGMTKLAGGVKALGVALKGNWLTIVIGAIASLAAELYNLNKRMKDVNAEIDEQNLNLYETKERLEGYQTAIERNNKALEGSTGKEEALKKRREENAEILSKLKNDYPQLAEGMELQKNGVIKLTDALRDENEELERQMMLAAAMKQQSIFDENFTKDSNDAAKKYLELQQKIIAIRQAAKKEVLNLQLSGQEDIAGFDVIKKISEIDPTDVQKATELLSLYNKQIDKLYDITTKGRRGQLGTESLKNPVIKFWGNYLVGAGAQELEVIKQAQKAEDELIREYDKLEGIIGYIIEEGVKKFYGKELQSSGLDAMKWYALNADRIQTDVENGVNDFYRTIREMLIKYGNAESPGMKNLINTWFKDTFVSPIENGYQVLGRFTEDFLKKPPFALSGTPNVFATKPKDGDDGGDTETPEEKQAKIDAAWRRRIQLLEEMKRRYDELSKSAYGYTKSEADVRKAFEDSYNEIFVKNRIGLKSAIPMDKIDFTSMESMYNSFILLLEQTSGVSAAVIEELKKKKDSFQVRIEIDPKIRIREDFGRQMEEAFGNYELTLDLQKLNLPKGLAAELWGIQETDMEDLRRQLSNMFEGLKDENGNLAEDSIKKYEQYLNKIDDLERKQQRERLKDYSKYLEYQYSERVKLEMDYVRKVAQLEAETGLTAEQKKAIRDGIDKEYKEKSRKQDWEDFKGSEFYVQMMEDLERHSTLSLEVMRKRLLEMRENAENLYPRDLKEVVNALEKIDKLEAGRKDPFVRWKEALDAMRGVEMRDVYEELAKQQDKLSGQEEEQRQLESMIALEQERNRLALEGYNIDEARVRLSQANSALFSVQSAYDNFKSDGTLPMEQTRAALQNAVNNAKADVDKWMEIVRILSGQAVVDAQKAENPFAGMSLLDMQKRRAALKEEIDELQKSIDKNEDLAKKQKELNDATQAMLESIKGWAQSIGDVYDSVLDTLDYFNDSTTNTISQWKELGSVATSSMNSIVDAISTYNKANASALANKMATGLMSTQGVALMLSLLAVLFKVITSIAKINDSWRDKEIEQQQRRIDSLTDAYARLERQIERTWDSVSYMSTYNQQVQNLNEQYRALSAQIASEEAKKNTDKEKLRGYQNQQQQVLDQLDDIKQKQREVFGGVSEDSYRSVAEGFVEAWKSAFLETGDGLQALQDHFEEFLQVWFVKQATMQGVAKYYEKVFDYINNIVEDGSVPTYQQIENARELADEAAINADEFMRAMAGVFGIGDSGSLSGLAAGIQGMTEEQANILESYWNSVRLYTANIDMNVQRIADILGAGGVTTNPLLAQLQLVSNNTQLIHQLLQATSIGGHPRGGIGFKVFND